MTDTKTTTDKAPLLERELQPRRVTFWGAEHVISPRLLDHVFGDGRKVIGVRPLESRPNYYVARIDSQCDMDGDDFRDDVLEQVFDALEEQFGPAHDNDEEWPWPAVDLDTGSEWFKIDTLERPDLRPERAVLAAIAAREGKTHA